MDEFMLAIERHEEKIKNLSKDIAVLREVQSEIKAMNETLVILAAEIKHTNEHLGRHEKKLDEIEGVPKQRLQQIITAIIAALAGAIISSGINLTLIK